MVEGSRILLPICSFRQCRFLVFLYHQLFCLFASFNQIEKAFLCVFFQGAGDLLCSISRAFRWLELKMQRVRGFKFANSNQNLKTGYLLAADAAPTAGISKNHRHYGLDFQNDCSLCQRSIPTRAGMLNRR
ncbi:uncharacterized protein [Solanum lycopersicum]|uniref:uncharacterized protein isoform X2 n=1 Tax=Solanum lycopersicum TaxID=4081 RepID=UPI003749DDCC